MLQNTTKNLNRSIQSIDGNVAVTTTPTRSGPGSNGNKGIFYTPQCFRTLTTPSGAVYYHTQDTPLGWGLTPLQRMLLAYSKPSQQRDIYVELLNAISV